VALPRSGEAIVQEQHVAHAGPLRLARQMDVKRDEAAVAACEKGEECGGVGCGMMASERWP
jgi:hypothetical protein